VNASSRFRRRRLKTTRYFDQLTRLQLNTTLDEIAARLLVGRKAMRNHMIVLRRRGVAVLLLAGLGTLTGCGSGLAAKSSCQSFLNASEADQNAAVSKLAGELHAPEAATPLGRPNINYLCASDPRLSLGEAVNHTR
jgi:hypothetical protein